MTYATEGSVSHKAEFHPEAPKGAEGSLEIAMKIQETVQIDKGIGKECKDYMVRELSEEFQKDENLFITSFWGLGAEDINLLRRSLKKISSRYLVVKNSIAKRALKKSRMDEVAKLIEGGVGIAFGGEDPINTAKTLVNFARIHDGLIIQTGILDGDVLSRERIKYISSLPSRHALFTKLAWVINSPISGFVNVLAGVLRSFVCVIQAYREKVEKQ